MLAKSRYCVAFDSDNPHKASFLWGKFHRFADYVKIESLYHEANANGFPITDSLWNESDEDRASVINDLKIHTTPEAAYRISKTASRNLGTAMITIHIGGGEKMCKKILDGAREGRPPSSITGTGIIYKPERPKIIGITELTTSDKNEKDYHKLVLERAEKGKDWGLDGFVCPINLVDELENILGGGFTYLVPGMSWGGRHGIEQRKTYHPSEIMKVGKDSFPVGIAGSAIMDSEDKVKTAEEIYKSMLNFKSNLF